MHRISILSALAFSLWVAAPIPSNGQTAQEQTTQQQSEPAADPAVVPTQSETVRFSFNGVAWREVINWIAEEAELALHVDSVPAGSFTYSDPKAFTHQEAIDRINLFLLPQGHTLVRSGNLLSVINLSDPRSLQQLDSLAELVRPDALQSRPKHDVVKCLFPLGALSAGDAVEELSAIKLMMQPAVFSKTNQLLVTDTVGKLSSVKMILDSFQPTTMDNGTVVKSFMLEHVNAEDILTVARPHLGLATGEMIGIDVSLSSDVLGKSIFVTGVEDKVKLIERLVESIDVADKTEVEETGNAILQAHAVVGGNVDLAYDVLQTLLAGQSIRISKDETAGTIVALAPPNVQKDIAEAVNQLAADVATFEVISLTTVDPYVAIGLIEEMLDLSTFYDDDEDEDVARPKIDADPENRRLFVRGKPSQIEEIRKIVEGLDNKPAATADNSNVRLLQLTGAHARQTLAAAARFWRLPNPILLFESEQASRPAERVVFNTSESEQTNELLDILESKTPDHFVSAGGRAKILQSPKTDVSKTAIECQLTSRGLMIQCDDVTVLNQFQAHLETLAGPQSSATDEPIVYYLKYTRPVDAIRMLAELLDGSAAVSTDSLINATVSSPGSVLGSLITNRDGTVTLIAGTATIVADSRLNRLIVQGTSKDVAKVEKYLRIIEKESSITEIETFGQSHIIELANTRATEVEKAIRQAFAGRVVAAVSPAAAAGGDGNRPQQQQRPDDNGGQDRDRKSDNKKQPKSASGEAIDLEPKMTLAVHQPSNSLIVTAPDHLYQQVENLARTIDRRGEQTVQVFSPSNDEVMGAILEELFEGGSSSSSRSSSRGSSSSRYSSSSSRSRDR
ncbi:secretin N-terminal domain-containing protein [Rhodopirellula sp. MGV]|uniref:secretin N-terminal domain-containing protein n=1 Tax=Rhodopirellula sp. MGV TaxID=2023130 RepID=UPI000B972D7C|nr:secretin N-terminal domain-containing protein [Rhodopirellula sp. MGV]OYP31020.1 hypothetical protein CGZ80_21835 [Rhodopirellula sp. MGV]PNY34632.1 general secretion pathway protein [Rhodopirellula baltica]